MSDPGIQAHLDAERSFERARTQAFLERIIGQLRGQPTDLLPFELVKDKLDLLPSSDLGLHEIPLERIVGSEGRYHDFTRSFLPRKKYVRDRWKRVYAAVQSSEGVPPIEVYQVGDVYFVKDGNHRVSVAREMGNKTIQAHVVKFTGHVPVEVDTTLDDLLLKAEKTRFLQHTHLDELYPEANVEVTCPGCYDKLEEHIAVHGYFLGKERQSDIRWQDAVSSWYENVYLPVVRVIREQGILNDFPGRTEADLYLWIMEHRYYLAKELQQEIDLAQAAAHFAENYSQRLKRVLQRATQRLADLVTPDQLEGAPAPGSWREERVRPRGEGPLFADILLPVDGSPSGWCALEQALALAEREKARLYGLYISDSPQDQAGANAVRDELARRCDVRGIPWSWIAESGDACRITVERARWTDLIVLSQRDRGAAEPAPVRGPALRMVVVRAARPVLVAVDRCSPLSKALLAYDGSAESNEALFVAAHVGSKWGIPLAVVTVEESYRADEGTLHKAVSYLLEHGVQAEALLRQGVAPETILVTAREVGCDWLIMGSSGHSPFGALFARTTVERVLREAPCPVLLCR